MYLVPNKSGIYQNFTWHVWKIKNVILSTGLVIGVAKKIGFNKIIFSITNFNKNMSSLLMTMLIKS
jgi:hypothetical protein